MSTVLIPPSSSRGACVRRREGHAAARAPIPATTALPPPPEQTRLPSRDRQSRRRRRRLQLPSLRLGGHWWQQRRPSAHQLRRRPAPMDAPAWDRRRRSCASKTRRGWPAVLHTPRLETKRPLCAWLMACVKTFGRWHAATRQPDRVAPTSPPALSDASGGACGSWSSSRWAATKFQFPTVPSPSQFSLDTSQVLFQFTRMRRSNTGTSHHLETRS